MAQARPSGRPALWRRWPAQLLALLRLFVAQATRPFSGPGLPNWYIYATFVLTLICAGSLALNIALLALIAYATW